MAKRQADEFDDQTTDFPEPQPGDMPPTQEEYLAGEDPVADMGEFDLEDEYKPSPLVPNGNYKGNVIEVKFEKEKNCITWKVCLDGNGGVMSDGETEIDGSHHYYRIWMPKPGDENEMEANGRVTKRQGKINRMKKFADGMKVSMGTPRQIAEAIVNGDWIGLGVICQMKISEYQGEYRNEIDRMTAQPE